MAVWWINQGAGAAGGGGGGGGGLEAQDPKLQYLKNLMLKYLGTDEGEAREHMERAIATVLQFSEQVNATCVPGWVVCVVRHVRELSLSGGVCRYVSGHFCW